MKKLLLTLFIFLFFSTTLIGGGLIFAGCNQTHFEEPGGGFEESQNENDDKDNILNFASCIVTYDANGGTGGKTQNVTVSNTTRTKLSFPKVEKTGYVFAGWKMETQTINFNPTTSYSNAPVIADNFIVEEGGGAIYAVNPGSIVSFEYRNSNNFASLSGGGFFATYTSKTGFSIGFYGPSQSSPAAQTSQNFHSGGEEEGMTLSDNCYSIGFWGNYMGVYGETIDFCWFFDIKVDWETTVMQPSNAYAVGSVTYVAQWTPQTYTNTYHYVDASGNQKIGNQSRTYGQSFTTRSSTYYSCYNSNGWSLYGWANTSYDTNIDYATSTLVSSYNSTTGTVNFYAISRRTITINYNANGGSSAPSSSTVTQYWNQYGNVYNTKGLTIKSGEPKRTGYTFLGWSTSQTATTPTYTAGDTYTFSYNTSNTDILYAVWQVNQHTIRIYAMTGISNITSPSGTMQTNSIGRYKEVKVNYNTSFTATVTMNDGYEFGKWTTINSSAASAVSYNSSYTFTVGDKDYILYAWGEGKTLTITLNKQGGSGGTNTIYLKYNTGWYSTSTASSTLSSVVEPTKTGYIFDGYYTSDNLQVIASNGQILSGKTTITTTNASLYAHWTPKNPAHQDASGKWYVEMGYFPQTKVTDSTLKNNIKTSGTATGVTYKIVGQTLTEYEYGNVKYALYKGEYYEVEPVRYILAGDYSSGYATETGSVTAVSEKIVFASVFQTGWTASDCLGKGYNDAEISANVSGIVNGSYMESDYLNSKTYTVTNFKMANGTKSSSDITTKAIASNESEIKSVFGDLSAEFSDLVADILGGYLFYWTRDVGSNLNNAQTISAGGITGTQMKLEITLGVRVTVNIKTLACS